MAAAKSPRRRRSPLEKRQIVESALRDGIRLESSMPRRRASVVQITLSCGFYLAY
jgi:hypothetical protein